MSIFTTYDLTREQEYNGQILNLNQKLVLQNLLATIAEEKVQLKFTPNDVATYTQREAELQGQMGIIQLLFALSDQAEAELTQAAQPHSTYED